MRKIFLILSLFCFIVVSGQQVLTVNNYPIVKNNEIIKVNKDSIRYVITCNDSIVARNDTIIVDSWDKDALAYFARFATQPSDSFKRKIDNFIKAQKTAGLWDKKVCIYLLQNPTSQGALLNMKGNYCNAVFVNSPTFVPNDGFTADVGYINTNFTPSSDNRGIISKFSVSVTQYKKSTNIVSGSYDWGCYAGNNYLIGRARYTITNQALADYLFNNTMLYGDQPNAVNSGIFTHTRNTTTMWGYRNGSVLLGTQGVGTTRDLTTIPFFIGCVNNNGNPGNLTTNKYGYLEIGAGLTIEEIYTNYLQIKELVNFNP
jgi:hypothetical protein